MLNTDLAPATSDRVPHAGALRSALTGSDSFQPAPAQIDNGDEARYADKSGTYTKGIQQDSVGLGELVGVRVLQEGPEHRVAGGLRDHRPRRTQPASNTEWAAGRTGVLPGLSRQQPVTAPPAPAVDSDRYATELVEMYWASLLRDVAFSDYPANQTAQAAAAELSGLPSYDGPREAGTVTPELLFRGKRSGEKIGPYLSQFLLQDTSLGSLPVTQKYVTINKTGPAPEFMTTAKDFNDVQNGVIPARVLGQFLDPKNPLYLHDGRGLTAYTHDDVLYQAYFIAYLVLNTLGIPLNPGNPYLTSKTQNGFATLGQPDIAATLAAVANEALKAVWYQKWWVHLRHRPESGGALVHLIKTDDPRRPEAVPRNAVLNSHAVQASHDTHQSFFLSQAFPEGSPYHPAYPTGHGTVAGACITALKFFFDARRPLPAASLREPSPDGTNLKPFNGVALTVNGELHKLASNISFGHGIHAGIHWRSDTDTSIELGEAVALSYLRDRARTYNERFTVTLDRVDGTQATISNEI